MNTKADFRATREMTGMSQSLMAEMLGVENRSVRRWESPTAPQMPPEDAWRLLDGCLDRQTDAVSFALGKVSDIVDDAGGPPSRIALGYYADQETFERVHPGEGDYRMANANTRLVATILRLRGYQVDFSF